MTRDEALRLIAELHRDWSIQYGDEVPYVEADSAGAKVSDQSMWQADRSAPAEIDDGLNSAIVKILAQVDR